MYHHITTHTHLRIALRIAAAVAALAVLLLGTTSAQAATVSSHVSWAPHIQRKIVHTRASDLGSQLATWYGPGFYGHRLACGGTLTEHTYGIAHRTLPCGTLVTLGYHGRRVTVKVIDRGPFSGASVDLTARTKQYLHFTSGSVRMTKVKKYRVLPRVPAHHPRPRA